MSANFSKYPVTFKQTHLQSLLFPNHPGTTFTKTFALSNPKCLPTIPSFQHQPGEDLGARTLTRCLTLTAAKPPGANDSSSQILYLWKEESADSRSLSRQKGTRASETGSQSNTKALDCIHVNPPNTLSCLFYLLVNFAQVAPFLVALMLPVT